MLSRSKTCTNSKIGAAQRRWEVYFGKYLSNKICINFTPLRLNSLR